MSVDYGRVSGTNSRYFKPGEMFPFNGTHDIIFISPSPVWLIMQFIILFVHFRILKGKN